MVIKNIKITIVRNISSKIRSHLRFNLSIIIPENKAIIKPGVVAVAIILPSANSEPVSWSTNQLIEIILKPNPTREMIFPKKNNEKVGLFNNLIMKIDL